MAIRTALLALVALLAASCRSPAPPGPDHLREARQALAAGQYALAETEYVAYLRDQPQGPERWEAFTRLTRLALAVRGDDRRAAELLEAMRFEFAGDSDKSWAVLGDLGREYARLGDWSRAADALEKRLALADPALTPRLRISAEELAATRQELIRVHLANRNLDQALALAEACRAVEADPARRADCSLDAARALLGMNRPDRAGPVLDDLVRDALAPDDVRAEAGMLLSDIRRQQGDKSGARAALTAILPLHPNPDAVRIRLKALEEGK